MTKPGPKVPTPAEVEAARKEESAKALAHAKEQLAKQGK